MSDRGPSSEPAGPPPPTSDSDAAAASRVDTRGFFRRYAKRMLVILGGFLLLIGGGIMLVTPGPGWLAIFAGLGILASEFVWAERLLERAKRRGRAAMDLATASRLRILLSASATVLGIAGAVIIWLTFR